MCRQAAIDSGRQAQPSTYLHLSTVPRLSTPLIRQPLDSFRLPMHAVNTSHQFGCGQCADSVLACWQSLTVLIPINTPSTHDQRLSTLSTGLRGSWIGLPGRWAVTGRYAAVSGRYAAVSGRATRRCRAATQQPTHDGFHDVCRYAALRHYRRAKLFSETQPNPGIPAFCTSRFFKWLDAARASPTTVRIFPCVCVELRRLPQ